MTKVVVLLMLGVIKLVFGLAPLTLARAIKKQKNDWWIKKFESSMERTRKDSSIPFFLGSFSKNPCFT